MLLLSLLATSIMELLSSFLGLRGKTLLRALRNMLASSDVHESVYNDFRENSLYRQLTPDPSRSSGREPSYIEPSTFQSILFDIILKGAPLDKIEERIEQIPDVDLKNVLRQLYREAEQDLDAFRLKVQGWFESIMDRASGWYKRNTQRILLYLGFIIAILFNADVLEIYKRLESDPEKLEQIVAMADTFIQRSEGIAADSLGARAYTPERRAEGVPDTGSTAILREWLQRKPTPERALRDPETVREVQQMILREIENAQAPLGLGWGYVDYSRFGWQDWLLKALGWTVTALSITLGAPFWFDLLKRLVNIRGSGKTS